jgi:endonuclease YncB( thermonuclease family)
MSSFDMGAAAMASAIAIAFTCLPIRAQTVSSEVSGMARIVDGDTIEISGAKLRLYGVDAPETDQVCLDEHSARWTCGVEARDRLAAHVSGREVTCAARRTDAYQRRLAVCHLGGEDVNAWMVREGWALAFVRYSKAYVADEAAAREAQRGLWRGAFIAPWDWRGRSRETIILGALSVPVSAQAQLLAPASAAGAPSPECVIKGNVNSRGERIFHLPGSRDYGKINMDKAGKRWFCSEEEAIAAGWRRARTH